MKIVKDFVLRNMADEYILIPTGSTTEEFNGMVNVSESAAFIWNNLEASTSIDDLVAKILDEYDVSKEDATNSVKEFLNVLLTKGIIEFENPENEW